MVVPDLLVHGVSLFCCIEFHRRNTYWPRKSPVLMMFKQSDVFTNWIIFMLIKLNRIPEASETAFIVEAGEETGHKFCFASLAVQSCSIQDYDLLIFSVSIIPMSLFKGKLTTVVLL